MFGNMRATFLAQWFCPCGQCYHQKVFKNNHMAAPVKVARNSPEPSETLELFGTLRNLPEVASGTYTSTHPEPSGSCLRNLHQHTREPSGTFRNLPEPIYQHTPELSGTFWNMPPEPTPAHTGTLQNLPPEPTPAYTGTFRKLPPEPTPAHTRTLRNLPPEPTPAYTGTLRNLLEPSSGTCSCDPHQHTPELIWAEDPISLRCGEKEMREVDLSDQQTSVMF